MFNLGDRIKSFGRKATVIECLDGAAWVLPDDSIEPGWQWSISDGQCKLIKGDWHHQIKNHKCQLIEGQSASDAFLEIAARHFLGKSNYLANLDLRRGIQIVKQFHSEQDCSTQLKVMALNEIYETMVERVGLLKDERLKFIETFVNADQYTEFKFDAEQDSINVAGGWAINNERFIGRYNRVIAQIDAAGRVRQSVEQPSIDDGLSGMDTH